MFSEVCCMCLIWMKLDRCVEMSRMLLKHFHFHFPNRTASRLEDSVQRKSRSWSHLIWRHPSDLSRSVGASWCPCTRLFIWKTGAAAVTACVGVLELTWRYVTLADVTKRRKIDSFFLFFGSNLYHSKEHQKRSITPKIAFRYGTYEPSYRTSGTF